MDLIDRLLGKLKDVRVNPMEKDNKDWSKDGQFSIESIHEKITQISDDIHIPNNT